MPFKKGNPGKPKGAINKVTKSAKEAFAMAFDELGGFAGMVAWAKRDPDNLKVFYTLYARLIPVEVTAEVEANNTIHITREVISKSST